MAMDKSLYRLVLGHFATGVAVLTTRGSTSGTEERPDRIHLDAATMLSTLPAPLIYYRGRYSHLALDYQHSQHTLRYEKEYSHPVKA